MSYHFEHSLDFSAAPERVFDALTDVARRSTWVPRLIQVQRLDSQPFGPGSRWDETHKTLGADDAVDGAQRMEAVAVERPHRFVVRQLGAPGAERASSAQWTYRFSPLGEGTRLQVQMEVDYGGSGLLGLLTRLLAKGTGPFMARQLRDELQALHRLLDVPR